MASRIRGFVFTLNNYTEEEYQQLLEIAHLHSKKFIFGKEFAPSTGTPHIQGYIYWNNGKTIKASRDLLPKRIANHEPAKGTPKQNYIYCSKEGNFDTNMEYQTVPDKIGFWRVAIDNEKKIIAKYETFENYNRIINEETNKMMESLTMDFGYESE